MIEPQLTREASPRPRKARPASKSTARLAFLGLGDASRVSWGSIMRDARNAPGLFYSDAWLWWMLPAILAIILVLLGLTFLGVAVEQRVNPRLARHHTGGLLR